MHRFHLFASASVTLSSTATEERCPPQAQITRYLGL